MYSREDLSENLRFVLEAHAPMIRIFYSLLLSFLFAGTASAQSIPVRIRILTDSLRPLSRVRIALDGASGGSTAQTDSSGTAQVLIIQREQYAVALSRAGYATTSSVLVADSAGQAFEFRMQRSNAIGEAVVTARKPLMRQDGDMTIVDPEPLVQASTNGYEVLEKTPGIIADQDGNFFLSSSSPASIYINGREMKLSATDLSAMLKSLPPDAILRVEILRTPSAKFDASGVGGIINIVLKKGIRIGLTGSVNAGFQQGVYGNQIAGINLSYQAGDKSAYLNLNGSRRGSLERLSTGRYLDDDSLLRQDAETRYGSGNMFLGYGLSKRFKDKLDLSYDGRVNRSRTDNGSGTLARFLVLPAEAEYGSNQTYTKNTGNGWNIDQSLDAKLKLDTLGSEWSAMVNWNGSFNDDAQDILALRFKPTTDTVTNNGSIDSRRHFLQAQTDLKYRLDKRYTLETGLKGSYSIFNQNSDFLVRYRGIEAPDPLRTASYRYTEGIYAAYLQVTGNFGKLTVKPGVRVEGTNMDGVQELPGDTSFSIRRTDLFPYLYISHPVMKIAGYELRAYAIYRKSILRPGYEYLNPFQRFVDQYLYETGNPGLRPQISHNLEANISIEERPFFAVGYTDVRDVFANVTYESPLNRDIALRTWDNLGRNREFYLRGLAAIPPGKAYFFVFGGQYNKNFYDGSYNGRPLSYVRESWSFFTYHNLKIGNTTSLVVNGFMRLQGLFQFYELGTFGQLNASLNQQLFHKKLSLTLAVQDMFFTNRYYATIDQGGIRGSIDRSHDTRRYGLNLRYNFGIKPRDKSEHFMQGEEMSGER
jgi:iron complex outermembrane receptor protein